MAIKELNFTPEIVTLITEILKRGNTVELKKEHDKLVVVEIKRQVKNKTAIIG